MNQVFVTTPVGNPRERYDAEDAAYEWQLRGGRDDRVREYEARTGHPRTYRRTPVRDGILSGATGRADAAALAEWHEVNDKLVGRVVSRDVHQTVPQWWRVYERGETPTWTDPDAWPGTKAWLEYLAEETTRYCERELVELDPADWRAMNRPRHEIYTVVDDAYRPSDAVSSEDVRAWEDGRAQRREERKRNARV